MNALAPFSSALIERLGWILIHSLWQFTLAAIVAAIIMRVMHRRSASTRYVVLIVTMSAAVLLPVATWMMQPAPLPMERADVIDQLPVEVIPPADEPVLPRESVVPAAQPLPVAIDDRPAEPVIPRPVTRDVKRAELTWSERIHNFFEPYLAWIVTGWTFGVFLCALRPLFGWYMLRRLKRVGTSPVAEPIAAAVKRLSQQLGITRTVGVMQSTLARVPVVVGYFRPVILLPASILTSIPPEQLEAILAHELAHVRRHDFVVNLLQTLVETLFFYHPAIWWMSRRIRIEREHCCDDLVIAALNNRVDYGRALVAIEELRGERTVLALGAKDGSLLSRVRRIVGLKNDRPDHFSWTTLTGLTSLCFVLAGLTFLGWSLIAQTNDSKTTTVVMEWSAMVNDEVLAEIRDLAESDGDDSTLHCSADELRAILARHDGDDDEVLLSDGARIIPPTTGGFLRSGKGHSMTYHQLTRPKRQEDHPISAGSSGSGKIMLQSMKNAARLRLDMTYETVLNIHNRSESVLKFDKELPASHSVAFVVGSGEVAEKNCSIIVIYEAITIPDNHLKMFEMYIPRDVIPTDVWCRIGADGLKKRLARAADWQSRPSTALSEPNDNWTRHLDHGGHVQLVALGRPQAAPFIWWTPDGKSLGDLRLELKSATQSMWDLELAAIVRIWDDDEKRSQFSAGDASSQFQIHEFPDDFPTAPGSQLLIVPAVLSDVDGQPSLKIGAGFGEWNEQTTVQAVKRAEASLSGVEIRFATLHTNKYNGHASSAFFWTPTRDHVITAIAVTKSGQSVEPTSNPIVYVNEPPNTKNNGKQFHHPIDGDSIDHFIIKSRPCQWVEFTDFAIEPAEPLNPPLDFDNPEGTEPTAKLPGDITVKLVGVGYHPSKGKTWWAPNGGKLEEQPRLLREEGSMSVMRGSPEQAACREFLIHITGLPKDHAVHTDYGKSAASGSTYSDGLWVGEHAAGPFVGETTSFRLGLTTEPFGPTVTIDAQGNKAPADLSGDLQPLYDHVAPKRVEVVEGKTTLVIDASTFNNLNNQAAFEIQAIDRDGNKIDNTSNSGYETESTYGFNLPLEQLDHFEYRMRPYRHWVTFENVSLEPGVMTDVKVKVDSPPEPKKISAKLPDGVTIELLGVGPRDAMEATKCWKPDGSPLADLKKWPDLRRPTDERVTHEVFVKHSGLSEDQQVVRRFPEWRIAPNPENDIPQRIGVQSSAQKLSMKIGVTDREWGPWQRVEPDGTIKTPVKVPEEVPENFRAAYAKIVPDHVKTDAKSAAFYWKYAPPRNELAEIDLVAVDKKGAAHRPDGTTIWENPGRQLVDIFRLDPSQIDHFKYRLNPYRHWVTFENVSLEPGVMTDVKVKVESLDLADARVIANEFIVAMRRQEIPFLTEDTLTLLGESLQAAIAEQLTKPLSQQRRDQLKTAISAHIQREFKPADSDDLYLNFKDLYKTLEWSLAAAIKRGEPTPEQARQLAVQRDWMRAEILKLPESAKFRLTHADELAKLESLFADPLNPFFQEPMTNAEFAKFQAEYGDRIGRHPSETQLNGASIYLFAAAFDVLRERLLPLRTDVAESVTVFIESEKPGATSAVLLDEEIRQFTIDVHVVPSQQWGFRRSNFSWSLNFTPHVSSLQPNDVRQSVSGIYADVINMVYVSGDAPADMSARAAWLEEKNQGDLAYDGTDDVLLGVRGAKLAVLDAKSWYEADRVSTEELQALIEKEGKNSLSLTHFAEPFAGPIPTERPPRNRKESQPSLVVQTGEGRIVVIRFLNVDRPVFKSRPRPAPASGNGRPGDEQSQKKPANLDDLFSRRVSLTAENMPLQEALRKLAQSGGVTLRLDVVALAATELDLNTPVNVTIIDEPLGQAMLALIDWNDYQGVIRELRKGELVITTIAARQQRTDQAKASLPEEQRNLLKPGVHVEFDDDGQVVSISAGGASAEELLPQLKLFPHLREFNISGTKSNTAESLAHLSELTELQKLSLSEIGIDGAGLGDVALKQIVGLKSLRELSLLDCGVTDEGIRYLEDMPGLTRLEINGEGRLTDAAVASIAKVTRLKSLSLKQFAASERLGRMHFSSEGTRALAGLQELEHLNLVGQEISAETLQFSHLKSLALGLASIDNAHAARIAKCRELRSLTLVLTDIGNEGLNLIADLPNLRMLELKSDVITDAGVAHLSRLKALDHLQLSGAKLTDDSLRSLAKIETLSRIDLNSGKYSVNGVSEFKALPKLRTLWLMNFTAQGSYSALNELTQLRELVFESADITQEDLNALQEALPNTQMRRGTGGGIYLPDSKQKLLQVKPILEPSASNDGHAIPEEWKKLLGNGLRVELNDDDQIVSLTVTDALSDEFLSQLKNVPTLRELEIVGSKPITREGLAHLAELSGLEKLVLSNLHRSGDGLGDIALEYVVKIKSLRELRMGNCGITDRGLQRIETMSGLTSLALSHEGRLTDGAIGSIVKLKRLKYLYVNEQIASKELGRMHFSAEATGLLTTLGELEHLHLIGQEISADALRFPLLESLSLGGRGPASLRLPQNGSLDDTHAVRIAECRNLKSLNLTFCNVSDEGLNSIASLPSLERLEIVSPTVTDIGIKRLARLPMLNYIALDTPNISNVSMRDLAKMKSLEEIHLSSGNIQYTDLKALEPLPRLHTLLLTAQMLRAYTGSYAALGELTQLRTLILINNDPGGLTERELHALAKALPNVSIPQF